MNKGTCKTCKAPILWAKTENGKAVPLDAEPIKRFIEEGEVVKLVDTYVTHFATCPQADQHRRRVG